jgi:hypothetical protein
VEKEKKTYADQITGTVTCVAFSGMKLVLLLRALCFLGGSLDAHITDAHNGGVLMLPFVICMEKKNPLLIQKWHVAVSQKASIPVNMLKRINLILLFDIDYIRLS